MEWIIVIRSFNFSLYFISFEEYLSSVMVFVLVHEPKSNLKTLWALKNRLKVTIINSINSQIELNSFCYLSPVESIFHLMFESDMIFILFHELILVEIVQTNVLPFVEYLRVSWFYLFFELDDFIVHFITFFVKLELRLFNIII